MTSLVCFDMLATLKSNAPWAWGVVPRAMAFFTHSTTMTSETFLRRWVDKAGWDQATQLRKLLEFIEEHGKAQELDKFLAREALYERLQPFENTDSELLDDSVQDANAHVESNINNQGVSGQLEFLIDQWGADDVEGVVGDILYEKKEKLWPKQKRKRKRSTPTEPSGTSASPTES